MPSTHTWRFASQGLLKRRRRGADTDDSRALQDPPRPVGGAVWLPETPLPAGLPPLPRGFEPAATAVQPRLSPDAAASRH
ncbi:hypothetical protein [Streptomyces sp. NPDC126522]|uniref:hypothetical protein n=1 Tax=Streptomyces sp. NPDC126522 TaxID=3155211 RepID=UPI0033319051